MRRGYESNVQNSSIRNGRPGQKIRASRKSGGRFSTSHAYKDSRPAGDASWRDMGEKLRSDQGGKSEGMTRPAILIRPPLAATCTSSTLGEYLRFLSTNASSQHADDDKKM